MSHRLRPQETKKLKGNHADVCEAEVRKNSKFFENDRENTKNDASGLHKILESNHGVILNPFLDHKNVFKFPKKG